VLVPETSYAKASGGWVAYQTIGTGPADLLIDKPQYFPIDLLWEEPSFLDFGHGLATFSRAVWFDVRGTGSSDAIDHTEGRLIESNVDDMLAVLDDLRCDRVFVVGLAPSNALMFAATHPERTKGLVLINPTVRIRRADDYPAGLSDDSYADLVSLVERTWGTGWLTSRFAGTMAQDEAFLRWCARCERLSMTHDEGYWRTRVVLDLDLRHVLSTIGVPTLVITRAASDRAPQSRYVASHIAGAQTLEFSGDDSWFADEGAGSSTRSRHSSPEGCSLTMWIGSSRR